MVLHTLHWIELPINQWWHLLTVLPFIYYMVQAQLLKYGIRQIKQCWTKVQKSTSSKSIVISKPKAESKGGSEITQKKVQSPKVQAFCHAALFGSLACSRSFCWATGRVGTGQGWSGRSGLLLIDRKQMNQKWHTPTGPTLPPLD